MRHIITPAHARAFLRNNRRQYRVVKTPDAVRLLAAEPKRDVYALKDDPIFDQLANLQVNKRVTRARVLEAVGA